MHRKISIGIPRIDELFGGEIYSGSIILVQGMFGSGKSTLGAQFLVAGAKTEEIGLLILAEESPESYFRHIGFLGIEEKVKSGTVKVIDISLQRLLSAGYAKKSIENQVMEILAKAEESGARRMVIDSLNAFVGIDDEGWDFQEDIVFKIAELCRKKEITTLILLDPSSQPRQGAGAQGRAEFVADGVISLEFTESGRKIQILKMRGAHHDLGKHSFVISSDGIRILPSYQTHFPSEGSYKVVHTFGLPKLDRSLGGGLSEGTWWLGEQNHLCTPLWDALSFRMIHRAIEKGFGVSLDLPPGVSVSQFFVAFQKYCGDYSNYLNSGRLSVIDYFDQTGEVIEGISTGVWFTAARPDQSSMSGVLDIGQTVRDSMHEAANLANEPLKGMMVLTDLTMIVSLSGEKDFLETGAAYKRLRAKEGEVFLLAFNPNVHSEGFVETIRSLADGIIQFSRVEGVGRLQVVKAPYGIPRSPPFLIEELEKAPFIRLYR